MAARGEILGSVFVEVAADTTKLQADLERARRQSATVGRAIEASFGRVTQVGLAMGRGLTAAGQGFTALAVAADRSAASVGKFGASLLSLRGLIGGTIAVQAIRSGMCARSWT